ncbi:MAG: Rrf2 family transcriptional regulator [Myxococcales bacterium]|jgi:Rrf2 family protein|nr:Rrf2 family transcriptional regulator [Myxococcales bacterium]
MKLTTKGRYGLRLMLELARHYGQGPVLVDRIAQNQALSPHYVHVLVTPLKTAGLVRSLRGPNGGYELAKPPAEITAFDIIQALEGDISLVQCTDDHALCQRAGHCVSQSLWAKIDAAVEEILQTRTLDTLLHEQLQHEQEHPLMFHI